MIMKGNYYKIAGHTIEIIAPAAINLQSYLPTFKAFESKPVSEPCFSITLLPQPVAEEARQEITHFEWEGATCFVFRTITGYQFEIHLPDGQTIRTMSTNAHFNTATAQFYADDASAAFIVNNFLMMLYAFATAPYRTLMMHASVIIKDNRGYLFLGKSGTGKSTHSSLWLKHIEGTELLNDDNPIVCIDDNGHVTVYGSPWSGKTPCYRNLEARVAAFVQLEQAPKNSIKRQTPAYAFATLLPSCSNLRQDKKQFDFVCGSVATLASTIPTFLLKCLPNEAAARLCYETIAPITQK